MISIVIPAHNESQRIEKVLKNYAEYFKNYIFEIIVVCDGNDDTDVIIHRIMQDYPCIRLYLFDHRLGKGGAIIEGFKKSTGDVIGFVDCDESVSPQQFEKLLYYTINSDCVVASRKVKGSAIGIEQSKLRTLSSNMFNIIVNKMFNLDIKDTQCGAKVMKRYAFEKIQSELQTTGFEFDVELLWKIKNGRYTIREVPIIWNDSRGSSFSLKYAPLMLINLIRIRFWK